MEPFVIEEWTGTMSGDELSPGPIPRLMNLEAWRAQDARLQAGFTTRSGGTSRPPYHSLNCAYHVGDDPAAVLDNRIQIAGRLGFEAEAWTCGEQVHGTSIAVVTAEDRGKGFRDRASAFADTDGMITNVPGVLLTSFYADCVPLYFWDPVERVVGLAHAGWKGTVGQIALRMITSMEEQYGTARAHLRAAIGPSIGSCCYEVDEHVMRHIRVLEAESGGNGSWNQKVYYPTDAGKTMLDLKQCNRQIMMKAGILASNIECTTLCTSCRNDLFFSYRKENGLTGRMASWIGFEER
ncbi:Laccase domain protein [compost metagenome]